jgi:hypothetical protein
MQKSDELLKAQDLLGNRRIIMNAVVVLIIGFIAIILGYGVYARYINKN